MNVEIGTVAAQFPEKKIHKLDFRCSVLSDEHIHCPKRKTKSSSMLLVLPCSLANSREPSDNPMQWTRPFFSIGCSVVHCSADFLYPQHINPCISFLDFPGFLLNYRTFKKLNIFLVVVFIFPTFR